MIHLALFLLALLVVLGAVGCTFSVVAASFKSNLFLGLVVLLMAGMFWLAVIAFVL